LQIVAGGSKDLAESSEPAKNGAFMLEQQLLEARKVLQATEVRRLGTWAGCFLHAAGHG
jgi:hypothetical protein